MSLCNESKLLRDPKGKVTRNGLPTEAALKVLVEKIGAYDSQISSHPADLEFYNNHISKDFKKLATLEFTRDRKSMSVLCRHQNDSENILFIKGAPDYLLKKSGQFLTKSGSIEDLTEKKKEEFYENIKSMAKEGYRTLAICVKFETGLLKNYDGSHHENHKLLADLNNYEKLEAEPILVGIVGLQDPPRPEVKESIKKCMNAGISVIVRRKSTLFLNIFLFLFFKNFKS
jgi:P-type Ca2+ transporter type 2C